MNKKARILGVAVMTTIMLFLSFSGINAHSNKQGANAQILNETNDAKYNVNNKVTFFLQSIEVPVSTSEYKTQAGSTVVKLNYNYSNDNKISKTELGNSTAIRLSSNSVGVDVDGRVVTLSIIINDENPVYRLNTSLSSLDAKSISTQAMDSSSSGSYISSSLHYKFRSGHEAVLDVTRVEILPLSFDTIAQILAIFGAVVATEGGTIGATDPALDVTGLIAAVIAGVAVDFGALYAYALENGYKTVYLDIGGSWGIYWYNFWELGAYGEEGVYSNNFNQGGGLYYPILTTEGVNSRSTLEVLEALIPHTGAWNPNAEPPW